MAFGVRVAVESNVKALFSPLFLSASERFVMLVYNIVGGWSCHAFESSVFDFTCRPLEFLSTLVRRPIELLNSFGRRLNYINVRFWLFLYVVALEVDFKLIRNRWALEAAAVIGDILKV